MILQVNANGVLSFRATFSDFSPDPFPLGTGQPPLIALYWDDHDVRDVGEIFFRTTQNLPLLNEVKNRISEIFSTSFTPTRLLIVTWDGAMAFSSGSIVRFHSFIIAVTVSFIL